MDEGEKAGIATKEIDDKILNMIQLGGKVSTQDLLKAFVDIEIDEPIHISRATLYRAFDRLEESNKIERKRVGKEVFFFIKSDGERRINPRSGLDYFLEDEAKKLVSDIIASGLLQPSSAEIEESNQDGISMEMLEMIQTLKPMVTDRPITLTNELLADNARRREARLILLRRCSSLHEALRSLQMERTIVIPGWWGVDYKREFIETTEVWKTPPTPGSRGSHLMSWMIYLLGAIDVLSRDRMYSGK